jgi:hypothetical protein
MRDACDHEINEFKATLGGLDENADATVEKLKTLRLGRLWLVERWERLAKLLEQPQGWSTADCVLATQLQGFLPDLWSFGECPEGWSTRFFGALSGNKPDWQSVEELLIPVNIPVELRNKYNSDSPPPIAVCREWLRERLAEFLEPLRALQARLHNDNDDLDSAEAAERSLILRDPVEARLFLRYHSEARTSFHRAYSELIKTLKSDAESPGSFETVIEAPAEVPPPPPTPPEPVSPNEANSATSDDDPVLSALIKCLEQPASGGVIFLSTDNFTNVDMTPVKSEAFEGLAMPSGSV